MGNGTARSRRIAKPRIWQTGFQARAAPAGPVVQLRPDRVVKRTRTLGVTSSHSANPTKGRAVYQGFTLDADQVVATPIDELALRILADVVAVHADPNYGLPNEHSWLQQAAQGAFARRRDAMQALSEAWTWLRSKTLVAYDPTQSFASGFVFVTR